MEADPETKTVVQTITIDGKPVSTKIVKIQKNGEKDKSATMLIIIAFSVVILILAAVAVRFFTQKKKIERAEVEMKIKKANDNQVVPKYEIKAETKEYVVVNRSSINCDEYQPQYDANNDFRIFGVGDMRQGGIQDMQEKMNMADNKNGDSSSDDEGKETKRDQMA